MKRNPYNPFQIGADQPSSFINISDEQLEAHMAVDNYEGFLLTDAVRPAYDVRVKPVQGFRRDVHVDRETGQKTPFITASASREILLDLLQDLILPIGDSVDVVLETSHEQAGNCERGDLYREGIDSSVLRSTLLDYEDILMNDGRTGIAVLDPRVPVELQFDEHKLFIMYGFDLTECENILRSYGVPHRPHMQFLTEGEHVHSSSDTYWEEFQRLKSTMGFADPDDQFIA